jgi:hypothetical protein
MLHLAGGAESTELSWKEGSVSFEANGAVVHSPPPREPAA